MRDRKKLLQKIASYCSVAASAIGSQNAIGQMVYTDVTPDYSIPANNGYNGYGYYDVDLNNDGVVDFRIQKDVSFQSCRWTYYGSEECNTSGHITVKALSGEILIDSFNGFDRSKGDSINSKGEWVDMASNFSGGPDRFIGVRLNETTGYKYGWIRLELDELDHAYFVIKDYAYDSILNQGIVAGQGYDCSKLKATIETQQSCIADANKKVILQAIPSNDFPYHWMINGKLFGGIWNQSYFVATPDTYRVIINDALGCIDTSDAVIVSNHSTILPPVITITDSMLKSSPAKYYQWYFGDNPIEGATKQNHSPPVAGNYGVLITDAEGCSAFSTIDYHPCLNYQATAILLSQGPPCLGNSFAISTDAQATSYRWQINGIDIASSETNASLNWVDAIYMGNYRVIVMNDEGCIDTSNVVAVLTSNPRPPPTITVRGDTLVASPSEKYQWFLSADRSSKIEGATNSYYIPSQNNYYYVEATDSVYCPQTSEPTLFESCDKIGANITSFPGVSNHCIDSYLYFDSYPILQDYSYQWLLNGDVINGATDDSYYPQDSGNYRLIVQLNHSCYDTTGIYKIALFRSVTISQHNDTLFSNHKTGNVWLIYVTDDSVGEKDTGAFVVPSENGIVELVYTDSNGCTVQADIYYFKCSLASIESQQVYNNKNCGGFYDGNLALTGIFYASDSINLQWEKNGVNIVGATSPNYMAKDTGVYDLQITTSGGCSSKTNDLYISASPILNTPVITKSGTAISTTSTGFYQWFLNGDSIAGATNSSYNPVAIGAYQVKIIDSDNCQWESDNYYYYDCRAFQYTITTDRTVLCPLSTVNLNIEPCSDVVQWQLNGDDVNFATGCMYSASKAGSYQAIVRFADCCIDTTPSVIITDASAIPQPIISQNEDTLISSSPKSNYWFAEGGQYPLSNEQKFVPLVNEGNYYVDVQDSNNCIAKSKVTTYNYCNNVLFRLSPYYPNQICEGLKYLSVEPDFKLAKYQWLKNGAQIPGATESYYEVLSSGIYQALVSYLECNDTTDAADIRINANPLNPVIIMRSDTLYGPPGYSYSWSRNGYNEELSNQQYYYPFELTAYKLTVTDSNGCFSSSTYNYNPCDRATITMIINPCGPQATISVNFFDDTATFEWYCNGSVLPGENSFYIHATKNGSYFVIAKTSNGCTDTSNIIQLNIDTPSIPVISEKNDTLFTTGTNNVKWLLDGSVTVASDVNYYIPSENSSYYVTALDSLGCKAESKSYFFWKCNLYDHAIIYDSSNICNPPVYLSLHELNPDHFTVQWFKNDQTIEGATKFYLSANTSGIYYCTIFQSGKKACQTDSQKVVVDTTHISGIFSQKKDTLFTIEKGSYQWVFNAETFPGGVIPGATNSTYIATSAGYYGLNITDSFGCLKRGTVYSYYQPCVTPKILNDCDDAICFGGSLQLFAPYYDNRIFTYQWLLNGTPIPNSNGFYYEAKASGRYSVVLLSNTGCIDTSSNSVHLIVHNEIVPLISQQHDSLICSLNNEKYQWYLNNQILSGAINQYYLPVISGSYTITVTDSFDCSNISAPFTFSIATPTASINKATVLISPNPSSGEFLLSATSISNGLWSIQIEDAIGNIFFSTQTMTSDGKLLLPVNLSQASPGVYLVKLYSKDKYYTRGLELIH